MNIAYVITETNESFDPNFECTPSHKEAIIGVAENRKIAKRIAEKRIADIKKNRFYDTMPEFFIKPKWNDFDTCDFYDYPGIKFYEDLGLDVGNQKWQMMGIRISSVTFYKEGDAT